MNIQLLRAKHPAAKIDQIPPCPPFTQGGGVRGGIRHPRKSRLARAFKVALVS